MHNRYSDVCAGCFDDEDLCEWIRGKEGDAPCDFCGQTDEPTADFQELLEFLRGRILMFYSRANDELWYDEEGEHGYGGTTYDVYDLLFEELQLDLPRDDKDQLRGALIDAFDEDAPFCDFDPARLDENQSMVMDWERFAQIVMYRRRFFFHQEGDVEQDVLDDSLSPRRLLRAIARSIDTAEITRTVPVGYKLYRARKRKRGEHFRTSKSLGPPPENLALQWNRMNAPGIPAFYGAESERLAIAETGANRCSVGLFEITREARILDLADIPKVPGILSTAPRDHIISMRFLHEFANLIALPVDRDDRTVLNYIPTQVFSEFLKDFGFDEGPIDGVRYRTATDTKGASVVLFATQAALVAGEGSDENAWIRLIEAIR